MPLNYPNLIYFPCQNVFSRRVIFYPVVSQPTLPSFEARGIFDTRDLDVQGMDGSISSDMQTILDIRDAEFTVMPLQLDRVDVPADSGLPAEGTFEILDSDYNGGGETTLLLRRLVTAKP